MSGWCAKIPNDYGEYEVTFFSKNHEKEKAVETICEAIMDGAVNSPEDVRIVRHGWWETYLDGDRLMPEQYYKCSICGDRGYRFRGNYCPNCGAKMDGGADR